MKLNRGIHGDFLPRFAKLLRRIDHFEGICKTALVVLFQCAQNCYILRSTKTNHKHVAIYNSTRTILDGWLSLV